MVKVEMGGTKKKGKCALLRMLETKKQKQESNNFMLVVGMMIVVVIRVHEGSLHFRKAFDIRLKGLTDVMGLSKDHVFVEHDVNLHQKL